MDIILVKRTPISAMDLTFGEVLFGMLGTDARSLMKSCLGEERLLFSMNDDWEYTQKMTVKVIIPKTDKMLILHWNGYETGCNPFMFSIGKNTLIPHSIEEEFVDMFGDNLTKKVEYTIDEYNEDLEFSRSSLKKRWLDDCIPPFPLYK